MPAAEGGKPQRDFVGLENPPVLQSDVPGRTFLLTANRIGSLNLGSPIMFRDLEVGEILGWDVGEMARKITIHAFVREPFDKYVHDNSRFWNASGRQRPARHQRLAGSGRIAARGRAGRHRVRNARRSTCHGGKRSRPLVPAVSDSEDAADASTFKRSVPFVANFTGSVSGLKAGSPVTLRGLKIGEVSSVSLVYDRALDNVVVPVHFTLEPGRISMLDLPTGGDLDARMSDLVKRGLRVKLEAAAS